MKNSAVAIDDLIVHTGQHYDDAMSKIFFDELDIPAPTVNLGIGSGTQGGQTARMLEAIENYLLEVRPEVVIVYGDTNSTLAGALAAAKLHIRVAHIEAGLRSFNRKMPEELNRIATDHLSDALFAPTRTAIQNLTNEGLASKAVLTGDVMYDAVLFNAEIASKRSRVVTELHLASSPYGVATLHRAENTKPADLRILLDALNCAALKFGRIVFPMHPRTATSIRAEMSDWRPDPNLTIIGPLGYLDMLCLVQHASWVITDSGGLQKEAYFLGCPCVTLRNETEWIETLEHSANRIAGSDAAGLDRAMEAIARQPRRPFAKPTAPVLGPFGDGQAAHAIVDAVCKFARADV
jgi:UDP-N-acetylglucosamine 2-epimerase